MPQSSKVVKDGINVIRGTPDGPIRKSTLFLRIRREKISGKPERTLASLYMVRPGRGEYVIKELISDMDLEPQAAIDKAVAIARRGDVTDVYLSSNFAALPHLQAVG